MSGHEQPDSRSRQYCNLLLTVLVVVASVCPVAWARAEIPESPKTPTLSEAPDIQYCQRAPLTKKVITYKGQIPITVDYDRGVYEVSGRERPILVDHTTWEEIKSTRPSPQSWVHLPYDRFDIFLDAAFYAAEQDALDVLFNRFAPRYELMEQMTGWSSEEFYGEKLEIYVTQGGGTCVSGAAIPGEAHIELTSFFLILLRV